MNSLPPSYTSLVTSTGCHKKKLGLVFISDTLYNTEYININWTFLKHNRVNKRIYIFIKNYNVLGFILFYNLVYNNIIFLHQYCNVSTIQSTVSRGIKSVVLTTQWCPQQGSPPR